MIQLQSTMALFSVVAITGAGCGKVVNEADDDGAVTDAAVVDAPIGPDAAPVAPNFVFASSRQSDGDLGGLAGADTTCNELAQAAGLAGTYVAWLSTEQTDAIDRLGDASGWIRTDGLPFAATKEDIVAGRIFYPITVDETNTPVAVAANAWTATQANGAFASDATSCEQWTNGGTTSTEIGSVSGGPVAFTSNGTLTCRSGAHLLCFGIDNQGSIDEPTNAGRIGFLSRGKVSGGVGVEAMDTICNEEATEASLPGNYKAAVASGTTSSSSPSSRFVLTGASWVRPDGVSIFANASDFGDGTDSIAPIAVTADLKYVDEKVWTGAAGFNGANAHCSDWTQGVENESSIVGRSALAGIDSSSFSGSACNVQFRVYCLQD